MRVLLIPFEIALLLARIPLDLRHRRLAELLALPACVPLLHHVCLRQPNTQRFLIHGMAVATAPRASHSVLIVVRCYRYMPALLMVRECTCACGWAAHGMLRPNVRWDVVIDVPTVLLSAIKLTRSPTCVLGAVERQLAPPPLRAYILPLNNFSGFEPYRSFRGGSDRVRWTRSDPVRKDR